MIHKTILIGALVTLAACSGTGAPASTASVEGPTPVSTVGVTQTPIFETTTVPALSQFEAALDSTITAGSYEFGGQLIAYVGSSTVTTNLHGWVDGTSQLIVTEATSGVVETLVVDGIASVTQNGSTSTVDLGAVESAPSFDLLNAIDIQEETPGMVKGTVKGSSADVDAASGDLNVTVWYSTGISAYEISDPNGAWELSMTFSNVGTFDSTSTP